jgi:hypothetical protein
VYHLIYQVITTVTLAAECCVKRHQDGTGFEERQKTNMVEDTSKYGKAYNINRCHFTKLMASLFVPVP